MRAEKIQPEKIRFGNRAASVALALAAAFPFFCAAAANPYSAISGRNIFGLTPPGAAPVETAARPSPAVITPNGILSLFGKWQVLVTVTANGDSKSQQLILDEGGGQDGIRVVRVDPESGLITFDNHGELQVIALAKISLVSNDAAKETPPLNPDLAPPLPDSGPLRSSGSRFNQ